MLKEKISALREADRSLPHMKHAAAVTVLILYASLTAASAALPGTALKLAASAVSSSLLASALYMYRRWAILFFPPAAAAAAILLSSDAPTAVFAITAPLFVGVTASYNLLVKSEKSHAVASSSAAVAAAAAVSVAVHFFSGGVLPSYDSALASLTNFFGSFRSPAGKEVLAADASLGLARYILIIAPALIMIAAASFSFIAVTLSILTARLFSFGGFIPTAARVYVPSAVSAGVYLISYLISAALIANTAADVVGYTAENLLIALLPAMMIHGERTLFRLSRRHDKTVMFTVLSVIVLLISPSIYLMFVSFAGACGRIYASVKTPLHRFWRRVTGGGDDDDDDDSDHGDGGDS